MTIKSEKALNYLESNEYTVSHKYGDEVPCIDPEDAKQAIIIAEAEAHDRAIVAHRETCRCYCDGACYREDIAEACAADDYQYTASRCVDSCAVMAEFVDKLNQ